MVVINALKSTMCGFHSSKKIFHVVCLLFLTSFLFTILFQHFRYSTDAFHPIIDEADKLLLTKTVQAFSEALDAENITYFMYGGALIGSYRHHGIIPWDDDVDVLLNATDKSKAKLALRKMYPEYGLYSPEGIQWKFYYAKSDYLPNHSFRWPYVDIFFFQENATHIWDELPKYSNFIFLKSKVFPLQRRPYNNLSLPAPCDPLHSIRQYGDMSNCAASTYTHKYEWLTPIYEWAIVPCKKLAGMYPFVRRTKVKNGWNETLELGFQTLNTLIVPDHC